MNALINPELLASGPGKQMIIVIVFLDTVFPGPGAVQTADALPQHYGC